ncbi:hypothetical protein ACW2Q0_30155 [Nocardia sp. R16R-3T]
MPDDAYDTVPACWWSRARWIAHNLALYDMHYKLLRRQNMVDSVSRKTLEKYLVAESSSANHRTGRGAQATVAELQKATSRERSTVFRCRRLTHKLGTRTTVFRGRQRTKVEALESWRREDPNRGWASVSALHETADFPVDNRIVETLLDQGFGTPPERSEGSVFLSRPKFASSTESAMKRCAPRSPDKSRRAKRAPAYDQKAVKLASGVRRDERFPLWVREIRPGRLAALLTRKAVAGWDIDDVYGGIEEFRISGKKLLDGPRNPAGYLWSILNQIPDDVPPARLDRARTVALQEAERAHRARQREEDRAQAMLAADGMNAEARRIRDELAQGAADRAARRARGATEARRELTQRARGR